MSVVVAHPHSRAVHVIIVPRDQQDAVTALLGAEQLQWRLRRLDNCWFRVECTLLTAHRMRAQGLRVVQHQ